MDTAESKSCFGVLSEGGSDSHYEWQWNRSINWGKVSTNSAGTTGWAKLVKSTNALHKPGTFVRIHQCAQCPCEARWPASKYGAQGPPIHLQPALQADVLSAVAALPLAPAIFPAVDAVATVDAPPAVAQPPAAQPAPVVELPPAQTAPAVDQVPPLEPARIDPVEVVIQPAVIPSSPKQSCLQTLLPPAPATPIDVSDDDMSHTAVAASAPAGSGVAASAEAARNKIEAALLALAREIRRPRSFVGYSAFILMGLHTTRCPCVWEGSNFINLLQTFAPWAADAAGPALPVSAIPCTLIAEAGGSVRCVPVSDMHPLAGARHYVAGIDIPGSAMESDSDDFEQYYAALGVAPLATVCDGDCGLDVMCTMLGQASSFACRKDLRTAISDYLIARIREPWMQDLMAACQELDASDVALSRSGSGAALAAPVAPAPAVAEAELGQQAVVIEDVATACETNLVAMRWASKLEDDCHVLSLIRALPKAIVEEQVRLHAVAVADNVSETALVPVPQKQAKLQIGPSPRWQQRMAVARRFHSYCKSQGIVPEDKLPYGAMRTFTRDHLEWKAKNGAPTTQNIRKWYRAWRSSDSNVVAADAQKPELVPSEKSNLRSRAKQSSSSRIRGPGAGRPYKATLVRRALYEWWAGIRYAIDWNQLHSNRRSRGKKHLARFPTSLLRVKVLQLLEDLAYSSLLNGKRVESFKPDGWWFKRWQEDYGLSMRKANRKYAVPRAVLKERLEIFWVVLFRLRLFTFLAFGYDPEILNFDQSPFHHNETGSQDKPTLAVRGAKVPVVEGNSDVRSRWTANLMTSSRFTAVAGGAMPPSECMFKAARDGSVDRRLQDFLRSRGIPAWMTVTVSPSGSYSEQDVVAFLQKHLEPWTEGREWRILLADDYSAHKTENIWALCWSRGYLLLIHGGGATPVSQTPDTDLNETVRRLYGVQESGLLIEKMRLGQGVPKLTHEECLVVMVQVLSDPMLHRQASEGYKKVGQSIDLRGAEDALVCREAGTFWNEATTDNFPCMRPKIDVALDEVASEWESGGIKWCMTDVRRMISPYPARAAVDRVLANLGEDFYHDAVHDLDPADDDVAVQEGGGEAPSSSSQESDEDDPTVEHGEAAVAGDDGATSVALGGEGIDARSPGLEHVPLSAAQADAVHEAEATLASLEAMLDSLKAMGQLRAIHCIEAEIHKVRRKQRQLVKEEPAVAEAFSRLRRAEQQHAMSQRRLAAEQNDRKREATKAIADRDAAVAECKRQKAMIQDMETTRATTHALKTFTLDALGAGSPNAGGAKAKKNRYEVLDRLARLGAGLSPGQKNDWPWFKEAWDAAMVTQHGANWAARFSAWAQNVLEDKATNAFSLFVCSETCRVFQGTVALHVPGIN